MKERFDHVLGHDQEREMRVHDGPKAASNHAPAKENEEGEEE